MIQHGIEWMKRQKEQEQQNVNESMVYDYYSIAHYSSAYDVEVSQFLTDMGYNNNVDVTTFDEPIFTNR